MKLRRWRARRLAGALASSALLAAAVVCVTMARWREPDDAQCVGRAVLSAGNGWVDYGNGTLAPSAIHDYGAHDCADYYHFAPNERCVFAMQCQQTRGYVNFLAMHSCAFGSVPVVSFIVMFLFLVASFLFLGQSAEDYFCPTLEWAADALHMSHNTAGVTILAIGNAAADISATMVGISHGAVSLAFGGVIGSAVFVSTFVVGLVVVVRPNFRVYRRPFIRDVGFYLVCITFFFVILLDGYITVAESLILMALYFVYVAIVLIGRRIYQSRKKKKMVALAKDAEAADGPAVPLLPDGTADAEVVLRSPSDAAGVRRESARSGGSAKSEHTMEWDSDADDDLARIVHNIDVHHAINHGFDRSIEGVMRLELAAGEPPEDFAERQRSPFSVAWVHWVRLTRWPTAAKWSTQFLYPLTGPIDGICRLTIPLVGEERWNWKLALFHLLACPPLFAFFTGTYAATLGLPVWALSLIISAGLGSAFVAVTWRHPERERWRPFFGTLSFVMAVVWMYIVARELVALLLAFGVVSGLSASILGIVLAWGNSLGDFFADVMIARAGNPLMGFSAAISGPTINLLIGVGGSFAFTTLTQANPSLIPMTFENWMIVGFVYLSYLSTLVVVLACRWRVRKLYGVYLIAVYMVFLTLSVLAEMLKWHV